MFSRGSKYTLTANIIVATVENYLHLCTCIIQKSLYKQNNIPLHLVLLVRYIIIDQDNVRNMIIYLVLYIYIYAVIHNRKCHLAKCTYGFSLHNQLS